MKHAFTMIELIFIIVILGILTAIAIPKLATIRLDAKLVKIAQNIMTGTEEIASYSIAQAKTIDDLAEMSNSMAMLRDSGDAILSNKKAEIIMGTTTQCIIIKVLTGFNDDNLTITLGPSSDPECLLLQSRIDAAKYPMVLRGEYVK